MHKRAKIFALFFILLPTKVIDFMKKTYKYVKILVFLIYTKVKHGTEIAFTIDSNLDDKTYGGVLYER